MLMEPGIVVLTIFTYAKLVASIGSDMGGQLVVGNHVEYRKRSKRGFLYE